MNNISFLSRIVQYSKPIATKLCRKYSKLATQNSQAKEDIAKYFDFHGNWPKNEYESFIKDMRLVVNFLSDEEEGKIMEEIEPYMKRLRYEYDHWDDAIHGFRETERKNWYPHNRVVLERVRSVAFNGEIMPFVHILDLAESGVIKPHVDSTRYCGDTISGMSLLSDCVMRLVRTDEKKFKQNAEETSTDKKQSETENSDDRSQPQVSLKDNFYADILLPRRSLYIMSHTSRFNYTHEILANDKSIFRGQPVPKGRRISVICRNEAQ